MKKQVLVAILFSLIVVAVHAQEPETITVDYPNLFPEGIEYDAAQERFLLSSMAEGTIFAVDADGNIEPFIEDERLLATVGIEVDEAGNRLLVLSNDPAAGTDPEIEPDSSLGIYDLESGDELHFIHLAEVGGEGRHLVNDVAVDDSGNAYVTDSLQPLIYKISPDGEAEILVEYEDFGGQPIGLNGIAYHPDGFLLVGKFLDGKLFKVTLDPVNVSEVVIDDPLRGADGVMVTTEGNVVVVSGLLGTVFQLHSDDGWESALITHVGYVENAASTAALVGEQVYVVYGYVNDFLRGQDVNEFAIVPVEFQKVEE